MNRFYVLKNELFLELSSLLLSTLAISAIAWSWQKYETVLYNLLTYNAESHEVNLTIEL